jgi:hypothetical protein
MAANQNKDTKKIVSFMKRMQSIPKEQLLDTLDTVVGASEEASKHFPNLFTFCIGIELIPTIGILISVWPSYTDQGAVFRLIPLGDAMEKLLQYMVVAFRKKTLELIPREMRRLGIAGNSQTITYKSIVNNFANIFGEPCMAEARVEFPEYYDQLVSQGLRDSTAYANLLINAFSEEYNTHCEFVAMSRLECKYSNASRHRVCFLTKSESRAD